MDFGAQHVNRFQRGDRHGDDEAGRTGLPYHVDGGQDGRASGDAIVDQDRGPVAQCERRAAGAIQVVAPRDLQHAHGSRQTVAAVLGQLAAGKR